MHRWRLREQIIRWRSCAPAREFAADVEAAGETFPPPRSPEACRTDPEVASALREGASLTSVALVRETGRSVKANLSINGGVLAVIDAEAAVLGLTRSSRTWRAARCRRRGEPWC